MARFIEASTGDRWHALWLILVTSGLRPGEALGLKWSDVQAERLELCIQRVLTRVDGQGWSFEAPKTELSRRTVAILPTAAKALTKHRAAQAVERLQAGAAYADHDLVFANRFGEPLDCRVIVRRHFKPLLRRGELPPIRPYDLRHTAATLAMQIGTPVKVISEALGHSTIKMTVDTYQHVLPNMQREAAVNLERVLFGAEPRAKAR